MTYSRALLSRTGLAIALSLFWGMAAPASLSLSPIRMVLDVKQPIGALTVRNDGDEPAVVQLEMAKWSQTHGKDVYAVTADILATPPIFTIPAGGSQLVRVGLRRQFDPKYELSYRLFLQEVPPAPRPESKELHMSLRFGVPVFVSAVASGRVVTPEVALHWQARTDAGRVILNADNVGTAHVQVKAFTLQQQGDQNVRVNHHDPQYVLPGQNRDWSIAWDPVPARGALLHLVADTDTGAIEVEVELDTR